MPDTRQLLDEYVITIRTDDQVSAAADAATAKLGDLEDAARKAQEALNASDQANREAAKGLGGLGAGVGVLDRSFQTLQRRLDPYTRALQDAVNYQEQLNRKIAQGRGPVEEYARLQDLAARKTQTAQEKLDNFNKSLSQTAQVGQLAAARVEAMATAAAKAAQAQEGINKLLNVRSNTDDQTANRAADIAAYGQELDRLRAKFSPVFALSQQYKEALREISEAQKVGAISAEVAVAAQGRAATAFANSNRQILATTQVAKGATSAFRALSIQLPDVVQGILTGQSAFQLLVQQGSQVISVLQVQGGLLSGLKSIFGTLVSPAGLAVAGITAVVGGIVALGAAAEISHRQVIAFQNALRATRDDYVSLAQASINTAKAFAANSTATTADAIAAAKAISSVPSFSGSQEALKELLTLSNDLATVWGKSLPESAKDLTDAMKDPAAAAQSFSDRGLRGFNQQLSDQVKLLQLAGEKVKAFQLVQDTLAASSKGAAESQTTLGRALTNLSNVLTTAAQAIVTAVDYAITKIGDVITTLRGLIPQVGGSIGGASLGSTSSTVVQPNTQLPPGVRDMIYKTAEQKNYGGTPELSGLQADFATQVAYHESKGIQSAVSAKGAIGTFQLMPGTAAGVKVNPYDQQQNIQGGLEVIAQLWKEFGGNPTLVAMAYNWNPKSVHEFLDGVKTLANVPDETTKFVQNVTGTQVSSIRTGQGVAGANVGGLGSLSLPQVPSVSAAALGGPGAVTDQLNETLKLANSLDTISAKRKLFAAESKQLSDELAKPGTLSTETYTKLGESLDIVNGRQATLRTATEEANKQLSDQAAIAVAGIGGAAGERIAQAMQNLDNLSIANTGHAASLAEKQQSLVSISKILSAELEKNVQQTQRQIAANENSLDAVEKGGQALDDYTALVQAQTDALADGTKGSDDYNASVAIRTESNKNLARSQRDIAAAQDLNQAHKQLELLTLEGQLIGATVDQRNREIAVLQERQKLGLEIGDQAAEWQQKELNAVAAVADMGTQVNRQKQAVSDVAGAFTSAFDTIGNAITNALFQGEHAAINWRNVMLAVAQQVLQAFLKFAILNPLLNSLFGQNNTTLSDIGGVLGGGGASARAGGGSILDQGGNLLTVGGLANQATGGGLLDSLGFSNAFGGVKSFLNSGVFGTSTGEAANLGLASSLGSTGDAALLSNLGTAPATGLLGGASVGSLLGGAGAGFGVGSLAGGYLQSSLGKVGPGPTIGAGVGSIAGAAIGSVIATPLIGGVVGGLLGGAVGGLIGPKAESPYSIQQVSVNSSGLLSAGQSQTQLIDETGAARGEIAQFNEALQALGITIEHFNTKFGNFSPDSGGSNQFAIGAEYDPNDTGTNVIGTSLSSLVPQVNFTSGDADVAGFLAGKSFASLDALSAAVTKFKEDAKAAKEAVEAEKKAISDYLSAVSSDLATFGKTTGSLNDTVSALTQQFGASIGFAEQYQQSTAANDDQIQQLIQAETDLTAARDKAIAAAQAAAAATVQATDVGLNLRIAQAQLSLGGAIGFDAKGLALTTFDLVTAQDQRNQLKQSLLGLFGDAYEGTQGFLEQMTLLEQTLGIERLVIAKQYDDQLLQQQKQADDERFQQIKQATEQAQQSATSAVTSLTGYTRGLQYGSQSALSPQDQLALAQRQFNAVAGAATAGDAASVRDVSQYSDTLLTAARNVYGSGEGYAAIFASVTDVLNRIAAVLSPEALTASFFALEIRTQTQTLEDAILDLRNVMATILSQMSTNSAAPTRFSSAA